MKAGGDLGWYCEGRTIPVAAQRRPANHASDVDLDKHVWMGSGVHRYSLLELDEVQLARRCKCLSPCGEAHVELV